MSTQAGKANGHRSTPTAAIPPAAQLVLDFFDNELSDVRFPDISQTVLQEAAERVEALADEVAKAEQALSAAREALAQGQEQLVGRCQRALAYARVFAEEDPDLLRRLDAVNLPRPGRRGAAQEGESPAPTVPSANKTRRARKGDARPPLFAGGAVEAQDDLPI